MYINKNNLTNKIKKYDMLFWNGNLLSGINWTEIKFELNRFLLEKKIFDMQEKQNICFIFGFVIVILVYF